MGGGAGVVLCGSRALYLVCSGVRLLRRFFLVDGSRAKMEVG